LSFLWARAGALRRSAELRVSASLDLILIWRAVLLASDDVMLLCRAMRDDSCDTLRRIQTLKMIERIGARKNLLSRTSAQAGIADLAGSPAELALGRMSTNERNLPRGFTPVVDGPLNR
jgi:hypothetical protein